MKVKIDIKVKNFKEKTEVPPKNRQNLKILDFLNYFTPIAQKSIKFLFKKCQFLRDIFCVCQRGYINILLKKKVFFFYKEFKIQQQMSLVA